MLALIGDQAGAAQAIEAVMPGGSARFAPFFAMLPYLSVQEKAAAVHLGMFPDNAAEQDGGGEGCRAPTAACCARLFQSRQGGPANPEAQPPARAATRPATSQPVRIAVGRSAAAASAQAELHACRHSRPLHHRLSALPPANGAAPPGRSAAQEQPQLAADDPARALSEAEAAGGNLSGIDKLLATIAEAPPPPQPKIETKKPDLTALKKAADKKAADKKAADKKAAAEKKARDEKLAAEKKAREEAARLGVKGTYWVQLAGGSNQDRMATEYKKLSAKAGKLLKVAARIRHGGQGLFPAGDRAVRHQGGKPGLREQA